MFFYWISSPCKHNIVCHQNLSAMLYWGGIVKTLCDGGGHFEYKCSYIQYRYASTLLGLYGVL